MPAIRPLPGLNRRSTLALGAGALATITLHPASAAASALTFGELYGPVTAEGIDLTPSAHNLVGKQVTLAGYMAPPLKAESDFFVLTRFPMSICPFCSNAADWPIDIVVVTMSRTSAVISPAYSIAVTGTLEFGAKVDMESGFVSLVRVVEADWRKV